MVVADFEEYETGDEVLFQEPGFSGSSEGFLDGTDNLSNPWDLSQVVDYGLSVGESQSAEIYRLDGPTGTVTLAPNVTATISPDSFATG